MGQTLTKLTFAVKASLIICKCIWREKLFQELNVCFKDYEDETSIQPKGRYQSELQACIFDMPLCELHTVKMHKSICWKKVTELCVQVTPTFYQKFCPLSVIHNLQLSLFWVNHKHTKMCKSIFLFCMFLGILILHCNVWWNGSTNELSCYMS